MVSISTLYTHFMDLVNIKFYNKNETNALYAEVNHSHNDDYPKKDEIGINLIPYTREFNITSDNVYHFSVSDTDTNERYENCSVRQLDASESNDYYRLHWSLPEIGTFKQGEKYTFSFWAKGSGNIKCFNTGSTGYLGTRPVAYEETATDYNTSGYSDGRITFPLTSSWKRYYVTWELNPNGNDSSLSIDRMLILDSLQGTDLKICGLMFEKGDYVHDWSPNPTDLVDYVSFQKEIQEINDTIGEAISYINL